MLSLLDTGMNAATHSTLNNGRHTWMGKPKQNKTKYNKIKPCVWGLYANEHKLAGIGSLQFHHLGIKWSQCAEINAVWFLCMKKETCYSKF